MAKKITIFDEAPYYDAMAQNYRGMQAVMHCSLLLGRWRDIYERRYLKKLLPRLSKKGDKSLVDMGCGNGRFFRFFLDRGYSVTGVDSSKKLLDEARSLYPSVAVVSQGYESFNPQRQYDVVFFGISLPNTSVAVFEKLLQKVFSLLAPGGLLIIIDEAFNPSAEWTEDYLLAITSRQGLRCVLNRHNHLMLYRRSVSISENKLHALRNRRIDGVVDFFVILGMYPLEFLFRFFNFRHFRVKDVVVTSNRTYAFRKP